jgi:acetyl esterase/lipase
LNDCLSVSRELFLNGIDYQINPKRIILSGDSAGGNLALVVSQTLIDEGYQPYLIALLYPSLQFFDFTLPSYRSYLKRNILGVLNEDNLLSMISATSEKDVTVTRDILSNTHTSNEDKVRLYPYLDPVRYLSIDHPLNMTEEQNVSFTADLKYLISPSMSPLLVPDEQLLRLPTILLFTTEFDIVRDEGFIFAARLRTLNKTIYHHHFANAFHGAHVFLYGPLRFEVAHQMIEHTARILRNHF